jgi:1,4-dihydroxy-2-naphthoate octaprenyltransferase
VTVSEPTPPRGTLPESRPVESDASPPAGTTTSRPSTLRIWLLAARPATLPAALSGVVVGIGAALGVGGSLRVDTALGCVAVALLLQVVANFANDLSDFRRGADTPDRSGPVRVAAAGLVTERQLELAIALTIGIAGIIGLWLAYVGGPVLLLLGVLAVVAALAYTGGPWPYGYRALGEVFVFIFFGLVAVIGTAYLQVLRMEPLFVAAAIPAGALITAILVVNNLRDIPTDRAAGKRTLAVILGVAGTKVEYALLLAISFAVPIGLALAGRSPWVLTPLISLPMAITLLIAARGFTAPAQLNPVLKGTARLSLTFGLLFAVGLALSVPS